MCRVTLVLSDVLFHLANIPFSACEKIYIRHADRINHSFENFKCKSKLLPKKCEESSLVSFVEPSLKQASPFSLFSSSFPLSSWVTNDSRYALINASLLPSLSPPTFLGLIFP